jgi:hypothetical protein
MLAAKDAGGQAELQTKFEAFLNTRNSAPKPRMLPREREALFKEFLEWQRR